VTRRVTYLRRRLYARVSASASFEFRSPKRLQVKFQEAGIATPTLADLTLFKLPAVVDILGQSVDTAAVAAALVGGGCTVMS
jgi:hypothetical protein